MFLGQYYLKRVIVFLKYKILILRGFCFFIILEYFELYDLELNEVLIGLFSFSFLVGEYFFQIYVGSVFYVFFRLFLFFQRGQVGVLEESYQIGEKYSELSKRIEVVDKCEVSIVFFRRRFFRIEFIYWLVYLFIVVFIEFLYLYKYCVRFLVERGEEDKQSLFDVFRLLGKIVNVFYFFY